MKKTIFTIAVILSALSLVFTSCGGDDDDELDGVNETSFTMSFNGNTYTKVKENSLILSGGNIGVAGTDDNPFVLIISGVGADGSSIDVDAGNGNINGSVILDFGAVVGETGFVSNAGTIKRTGKKIEVNVTGLTTSLETASLTATMVVGQVIGN